MHGSIVHMCLGDGLPATSNNILPQVLPACPHEGEILTTNPVNAIPELELMCGPPPFPWPAGAHRG